MQESYNEKQKRLLREFEGKNIAYDSVLVNSWVQNKMELDKTLLTLSSAGIGLIVAILTTIESMELLLAILFGLSVLGFSICIVAILFIYKRNPEFIKNTRQGKDSAYLKLNLLDSVSLSSFIVGVLFIGLVGAVVAGEKIKSTESDPMSKDEQTTSIPVKRKVDESLEGLQNLKPVAVPQQVQTQNPQQSSTSTGSEQGSGTGDKKKD